MHVPKEKMKWYFWWQILRFLLLCGNIAAWRKVSVCIKAFDYFACFIAIISMLSRICSATLFIAIDKQKEIEKGGLATVHHKLSSSQLLNINDINNSIQEVNAEVWTLMTDSTWCNIRKGIWKEKETNEGTDNNNTAVLAPICLCHPWILLYHFKSIQIHGVLFDAMKSSIWCVRVCFWPFRWESKIKRVNREACVCV